MSRPTEKPGIIITRRAVGAVETRRFVTNAGAQCTKRGQKALGVSKDSASNDQLFPVGITGTNLVEAGSALGLDWEVTTDNQGRAVRAASGEYVNGRTMSETTRAGDDIEIFAISGIGIGTTTTTTTSTTTTTAP